MTDIWQAVLTRRDLVKLGLVTLVAPQCPRDPAAPWSFVVFSDTHFGVGNNLALNRALLEEIAALQPELVLNAGDVTERGWAEEYDDVDRALAGLSLPIHMAPGNHDVRWAPHGLQIFAQRIGPPQRVFEHNGCVFAQLDSTVPLSHWGHIGGPQRRWLERELSRFGSAVPVFVFLHHAPGRQPAAVDDDDALADLLARFNTKVIFTGHGHSDLYWDWRGLSLTMARGLYQGSYLRVTVDAAADEIHLDRRTTQAPALQHFATRPLRARPRVTPSTAQPPAQRTGMLTPAWTQPLTGSVMSHLLLAADTLYLSLMDGSVLALDSATGNERWRATTGGYCHSSPVLADGLIIVGSADAHVYAFAADTGAQRWRFQTQAPVYASAAVARGIVAIASGDGSVYGLDSASGAQRWQFRLPPGPSAFAQSPAATDGERFFIGAWDRHVYALDVATGRELWRYLATPSSFYYSAAIAAPAVAHGRVYIPSNDNMLHALDAATGAVVWTQTTSGDKFGYSSPTVDGDRIYIGCLGDRGEVRCVAAADGRELWATATGATIYESSPALAGAYIAIGSVNGTLWLLDSRDGRIVGNYRFPPGHFISSPAADAGRVYAATFSETLAALRIG
ncbi:MAG TPA: PQQ-binding-like beta-propeller repeat protein [Longimicrobiales bacterium]|nr:PQQ-binding-like beta-propeller repeat protein [Longimicrobiales bacterium]